MNQFNNTTLLICLALILSSCTPPQEKTVTQTPIWQPFVLDFEGPASSEKDAVNPFTNYSLQVDFSKGEHKISVNGFFAADGDAANSSADSGNVWRVLFMPDQLGEWSYQAYLKRGPNAALTHKGEDQQLNNSSGTFTVVQDPNAASDFYTKGKIRPKGQQLAHANGDYFLKGGAGSPENVLAYTDFDGTYSMNEEKQFMKSFAPHLQDWKAGDPTWKQDKGKGLIGGLNYLASRGVNAIYFIIMNIGGDGQDVWPYTDPNTFDRFDCSKLDQWEIVFRHAQRLGIMLHFVTQETENELLLDNGDSGPQRKLYYKEMLARFGHHPGATWNLGEENGPANFTPEGQNDQQRRDMATAFKALDPYNNYLVIHTHSWDAARDPVTKPLLGFDKIDGLAMQIDKREEVYDQFKKWRQRSIDSGHPWVLSMDEIGMWHTGVLSDEASPHHDTIRQEVLWGSLMGGGAGVEWYFGWHTPQNDLNTQNWRTREKMWDQTKYAVDYFKNNIPYWEMAPNESFCASANAQCLSKGEEVYLVYQKKAKNIPLNFSKDQKYEVSFFNPYTGKSEGQPLNIQPKGKETLKVPEVEKDLAILIKTKN